MSKYWIFVSNVSDFEGAVRAKQYHGPLDTYFSTPSIEAESLNSYDEFERVEKAFPEHEVFKCEDKHVHFYDEHGKKYVPPLLYEDELEEE